MRNGLSWLTLGLTGLLLGAPSCGGDEATGGDTQAVDECQACQASGQCRRPSVCIELEGVDGIGVCAPPDSTECCTDDNSVCRDDLSGNRIEDSGTGGRSSGGATGKGGSGGSILGGSSGSTGKGGSAGSSSGNTSALGAACDSDADCGDDRLICLKEFDDGTQPPGGLCTLPCSSDGQCLEITDNAFCVGFSEDELYCIESCVTGSAAGEKCHSREDVACTIIGLDVGAGDEECDTSDDCSGDQLCSTDGVCGEVVTGCSPSCGADTHCPGSACDFRTGLCNDDKPDDLLPIGAACTVPDDGDPEPCDGFCVPNETGSTDGACGAFCLATPTGVGCGFDPSEGRPADAACLFATIISPPDSAGGRDVGLNDVMLCGKLCDCNAECPIDGEFCMDESEDGDIAAFFGRNGYCRVLIGSETEGDSFDECPDGSSGGSGGMSGTGGASGAGGTPSEGGNGGQSVEPPAAGQGGQGGVP